MLSPIFTGESFWLMYMTFILEFSTPMNSVR